MKKHRNSIVIKKLLDYSPFIISSFILLLEFYPLILNPLYGGDSGTRLKNAQYIVWNEGGGRYWLPLLQFIVHLLYISKVEFSLYKLIPFFFTLFFLYIFNLISLRYFKGYPLKSFFTSVILISFVTNPIIVWLSSNLYQEMPVIAFFYFLLYLLYFSKNEILLYITWIAAFLTREYFWIYYIILGFINGKQITSNRINFFRYFSLLTVPLIWLFYTNQSLVTGFNSTISPITIHLILARISRLFYIVKDLRLVLSLTILSAIICLLLNDLILKKFKLSLFEKNYFILCIFSFLVIYSYIIGKDPWAVTPFNPRMLFPLIVFLPLLYLILFQYLSKKRGIIMYFFSAALALSFFTNIYIPPLNTKKLVRSPLYDDLHVFLSTTKGANKNVPLKIGVIGLDYWNEYIQLFVGPLLYEKAVYLEDSKKILDFQILISNTKNNYPGFAQCMMVHFNRNIAFNILCRM